MYKSKADSRLPSSSECSLDGEFEGISKPPSLEFSVYSADDIESFVRETNLCNVCQVIFGPKDRWILCDQERNFAYKHHPSLKSLLKSKDAGCLLCIKVHEDFSQRRPSPLASPSEERAQDGNKVTGGSFTCWFELLNDFPEVMLDICTRRIASEVDSSRWTNFSIVDFPSTRHLLPLGGPGENILADIKSWVAGCRAGYPHMVCQSYRHPSLPYTRPTRLIHLDPSQPEIVQLVTVEGGKSYSYVTLSHRWGQGLHKPPWLSKSDMRTDGRISIKRLEKGVPISGLPRTFQDAIQIVRACGLSYIWIDSLCIFQDLDHEGFNSDWAEEADRMGDIYAGGIFNIAALDGKDSEAGLFPQPRGLPLPVVKVASNKSEIHQGTRVLVSSPNSKLYGDAIDTSELLSRGWVFQEVLLTPANLFCTKEQMSWSCLETSFSQIFHKSTNMPYTFKNVTTTPYPPDTIGYLKRALIRIVEHGSKRYPIALWRRLMRNYTGSSVTFEEDRIVAIAGIAKRFASLFPEFQGAVCHSGVWSVHVPDQLIWESISSCRISPAEVSSASTGSYSIPSWSPLSLSCGSSITCPQQLARFKFEGVRQLVEFVTMSTSGLDQFGRVRKESNCVEDRVLHLRGVIADIVFDDQNTEHTCDAWFEGQTAPDASKIHVSWDTREDKQTASSKYGHQFGALPCFLDRHSSHYGVRAGIHGLLLRAVTTETSRESSGRCNKWVRCGYLNYNFEVGDEHHVMSAGGFNLGKYGLCLIPQTYPDEQDAGQDDEYEDIDEEPTWDDLWKIEPSGEAPDLEDVYII